MFHFRDFCCFRFSSLLSAISNKMDWSSDIKGELTGHKLHEMKDGSVICCQIVDDLVDNALTLSCDPFEFSDRRESSWNPEDTAYGLRIKKSCVKRLKFDYSPTSDVVSSHQDSIMDEYVLDESESLGCCNVNTRKNAIGSGTTKLLEIFQEVWAENEIDEQMSKVDYSQLGDAANSKNNSIMDESFPKELESLGCSDENAWKKESGTGTDLNQIFQEVWAENAIDDQMSILLDKKSDHVIQILENQNNRSEKIPVPNSSHDEVECSMVIETSLSNSSAESKSKRMKATFNSVKEHEEKNVDPMTNVFLLHCSDCNFCSSDASDVFSSSHRCMPKVVQCQACFSHIQGAQSLKSHFKVHGMHILSLRTCVNKGGPKKPDKSE